MANVVWSHKAKADLQDIYDYIASDSDFYAERMMDRLIARTEILLSQPETGRIVPELGDRLLREYLKVNTELFTR